MAKIVTIAPSKTPLVDPRTGIINADWQRYFDTIESGQNLDQNFLNVTVVQNFSGGTQTSTLQVNVDASTLTGTVLAKNVVTSSLTSVGTLIGGATGQGFTIDLASSTVRGTLPWANLPAGVGQWVAQPTIIGQLTVQGGINVLTDILPLHGFQSNLGSFNSKFLALWCAELFVETLVAQQVMATIGGRIIVAPTNSLTADLAPGDGRVTVKYNNFQTNDILLMQARGQIEWLQVTSGTPTGRSGTWSYPVSRNYGGPTSPQQWYIGDAMVDTGTTGNGYIDLYSIAGVFGVTVGPTIVGNVRTGTGYNNVDPRWAIGNLHGIYGYSSDVYGAAFGQFGATYLTIDATNGIRILNNGVLKLSADTSGALSFIGGATTLAIDATNGIRILNSGVLKFNADTSGNLSLTGDLNIGTSGDIRSGATAFGTGTGYWLDYNAGAPRMRIGNPAAEYFQWDGTHVVVKSAFLTIDSTGITVPPANLSTTNGYKFTVASGQAGMWLQDVVGTLRALQVYNLSPSGTQARTTIQAIDNTGSGSYITVNDFDGTFANTYIEAYGAEIRLGAGATVGFKLKFAADSTVYLQNDVATRLKLVANNNALGWDGIQLFPFDDNVRHLGTGTFRWADVFAGNGTIQTSDARQKKNVKTIGFGTPFLLALRPVDYEWIQESLGAGVHHGFLAQEVATIAKRFGGLYFDEQGEAVGLNYAAFVPVLVKAFQELEGRLRALEASKN